MDQKSTQSTVSGHTTGAKEGRLTRKIEQTTAQVPSIGFLALAIGSIALSAGLVMTNRKNLANFVGLWVPTLLIFGLYNKLVKIEGSDYTDKEDVWAH